MSFFPFYIQIQDGEEFRFGTTKLHKLGTKGITEDGRVFRYCKASANGCEQAYWGAQDSHSWKSDESEDTIAGSTVGDKVIGDTKLVVLDDNGDHVADFFQDGWVALIVGSAFAVYTIKSSTAGGTSVTLTLNTPLAIDVAAGSTIAVYPSSFSAVERVLGGGSTTKTTVCVPVIAITGSNYFWGQTEGPCLGIPSEDFPDGSYEQNLVFNYEGSVKLAADDGQQRAGYRLFDYTDTTGACLHYMLQLE